MKKCSRCKETKSLDSFYRDKYHSSGYKSACKVCAAKDFVTWRQSNLEEVRELDRVNHYIRTYGLSKEEAKLLVQDRKGLCGICGSFVPLVIDHCHTSGLVRGRVCSSCNSLLGYSKDNITILEKAIQYLKDFYEPLS